MKAKKVILGILAVVLVLGAAASAWFLSTHIRIDGRFYPRGAKQLDLRGAELSADTYRALQEALPDCEIAWDVPFQGQRLSVGTQSIRVEHLTDEDVAVLSYLPALTDVDAAACRDYSQLLALQAQHPGCTVAYTVETAGKTLDWDTESAQLQDVTGEELERILPLLPKLTKLQLTGELPSGELLQSLRDGYPDLALTWEVKLGGKTWQSDAAELKAMKLSGAEELTRALKYLPQVQTVDLRGSGLSAAEGKTLAADFPAVHFVYERELFGLTVSTGDEEIDLSDIPVESTEELEKALPEFFRLKKVIMSNCGLSNEQMDELNSRYDDIRFVWTVKIGPLKVRTDDTWFAPVKFGAHVYRKDLEALRYCTDMVCVDIGHMETDNCDWAAYMPNLTYLIIGDTQIRDLSPLTGLTNLKFLEAFKIPLVDYTPLLTCTGLEDLNIGFTRGDAETIFKMQWLKNLWWCCIYGIFDGEGNPAWMVIEDRMPNTHVYYRDLESSTAGGWRHLDNYFAMRDYLGLFYMDG